MHRTLLLGCYAIAIAMAPASRAAGDDAVSGRTIFARGGAKDEIAAAFADSPMPLPPRLRRCAGCHAADGHGRREGALVIPPINWRALKTPREASPTMPGRPGYDDAALARALAEGIDPSGRTLQGMPRFRFSPMQTAALAQYLRIVGTDFDFDPGVTADEIRVGAVLPLSGPAAKQGQAMRAALESKLKAAGSIYGRALRLVAVDAGNDVAGALHSLLANNRVFALVGTMLPNDIHDIETADDVPVIAPLKPSAAQGSPNIFDVLAPREDQMRVLVDALAAEVANPLQLIIVGPDGPLADAIADQARRRGAATVQRRETGNLAQFPTAEAEPHAIIVVPGADFGEVAFQLSVRQGKWLLAGAAEALPLDASMDKRLRLVLPILPTAPFDQGKSNTPATSPIAIVATAVLIEGLKRMGARVTRAGLIGAIETLRDYPTSILPPLNFSRGVHVGSSASLVVRPNGTGGMTVIDGWRTPQ